MRHIVAGLCLSIALTSPDVRAQTEDWPVYGGDAGGMKYSPLRDIDRSTVRELAVAWTWDTGELPIAGARRAFDHQPVRPGVFEATPIAINDTLYVVTPYNRVVALDATNGKQLWSYDPRAYDWGLLPRGCRFCHRGLAIWTDGTHRRLFLTTRWKLVALDAATGRPVASFGVNGEVDVSRDLVWEVNRLHYVNTSPAVVFEDLVIVGSGMPDNRIYKRNPPGDIQAFDARTGKRIWRFNTIPQRGEYGNDTWEDDSWSFTGSTNVWAPFSLDVERGLLYFPVGTPNNDFYGGHRKGDNLFAESVLCLDARTGRRVWHFQTVRHGLWDYDLPAPPNLVTITVDGRRIDAVVALGKTGFTYVFDRVTGKPVWPIEDRPVQPSEVPGERAAPTQPFPTKPPPFAKQGFTEADLWDLTPELAALARKVVKKYRLGPLFTPPSMEGTVMMPGLVGGSGWGGAAFDPETGILYVKSSNWPHLITIAEPEPETADADYVWDGRAGLWITDDLPVHKPPYALLTAIDLNRGEHAWQVVFGDTPAIRHHPLLESLNLPPVGVAPLAHGATAGPLVTRGGIVFLGGGSSALHAIDAGTGATLWTGDLGGPQGRGNPMTYRTSGGRQYVVIAASNGDGTGARLVAFAVP